MTDIAPLGEVLAMGLLITVAVFVLEQLKMHLRETRWRRDAERRARQD